MKNFLIFPFKFIWFLLKVSVACLGCVAGYLFGLLEIGFMSARELIHKESIEGLKKLEKLKKKTQ